MSIYEGFLSSFSKEDLADLLTAYDHYITIASDTHLFEAGWKPVGVVEFFQTEYQNYRSNELDGIDPHIPEKGVYFIDGARIFNKNNQLMCQFSEDETAVPLRSRIQDIQKGDAFIVESGISGHLVRQANDVAHQNFDEPDDPWIVYDVAGDSWFEEDIANAPRALLAMEYGKDQSINKDLRSVSYVTLVRERPCENEQWADSFWVDAKVVPTVDLFREAVQFYLGTGDGLRDIKMTCEDFNWGDAIQCIPDFYWNTYGIYPADPSRSPAEMGLSPTANYNPITFVVNQDEVLIPDSYFDQKAEREEKKLRPLNEILDSAKPKQRESSGTQKDHSEKEL